MSNLYDVDVVEWSERQAQLLRDLAARQASNELPDWDNIIEEVESVGRNQVHSVEDLLVQALLRDLKACAWPHSWNVPHWRAEARVFRSDAQRRFTPSMRQKIDAAALFREAMDGLPEAMDGYPPSREGLALAAAAQPTALDEAHRCGGRGASRLRRSPGSVSLRRAPIPAAGHQGPAAA
jgi:hypothetical protein